MKTFKEIIAWQKGYELTILIYKYTASFPQSEEFGLKSEMRRACISYVSNIAEGFKKKSKKEGLHYYNRSDCSLEEIKCQTLISHELSFFNSQQFKEINLLCTECGKTLNGWMASQQEFIKQ